MEGGIAGISISGMRRIAVVGYFKKGETTDTAWFELEIQRPEALFRPPPDKRVRPSGLTCRGLSFSWERVRVFGFCISPYARKSGAGL